MQLGISSYTFNWWSGVPGFPPPAQPLTASRLVELAVAYGVNVVQICDNLPLDGLSNGELVALAKQSQDAGITIETGTRGLNALEQYFEIAQRLRAPLVRTLLDVEAEEAVVRLRESMPAFERAGITVGIENHDRYPAAVLRRIIDQVGSDRLGICLDTANSLGCGEGLATVLDALAAVTVNLHIKDFSVKRLPHLKGFVITGTPAGKGLVDVPAILERLRAESRDVNCILELWSEPEATVEASIEKENAWAAESLGYLRPFFT